MIYIQNNGSLLFSTLEPVLLLITEIYVLLMIHFLKTGENIAKCISDLFPQILNNKLIPKFGKIKT